MPKDIIDYTNTIIYKIYCKDENITDVYIGHTTNFIQRKYSHKIACNSNNNNLKIYNIIRNNGGWDNWDMIQIAKYNCNDLTEARIKEQEHYNLYKSTLNSCPPYVDKNKYFCKICKIQSISQKEYINHILSKKHNKTYKNQNINNDNADNAKNAKNAKKHYCEICDFKCSKQSNYIVHLNTRKHKNAENDNKMVTNDNCFTPKNAEFKCTCGNSYKHQSGLSRHKRACNFEPNKEEKFESNSNNNSNMMSSFTISPELIVELIKDNKEMKQIILEQNNTIQSLVVNGITNINNINNSNNKTFNLHVFLNETCKNAMNIMDFANSIQLKLTDLENVGELGYVDGISKIIIDNLKLLDVTERPVHCSDFKRDVLYIKDNDKWEKENENNTNIKKIINCVTNKNISLIPEWKQKNPDCTNINSTKSTKINKMIMEVMETDNIKNEKIIKKIAKEVIIDKN